MINNTKDDVIESCGNMCGEVVYVDGLIEPIFEPSLKALYAKAEEIRQSVDVRKVIIYTGRSIETKNGNVVAESVTMHGDFSRNGTFGTASMNYGYGCCH